jgi:hypothetical protein
MRSMDSSRTGRARAAFCTNASRSASWRRGRHDPLTTSGGCPLQLECTATSAPRPVCCRYGVADVIDDTAHPGRAPSRCDVDHGEGGFVGVSTTRAPSRRATHRRNAEIGEVDCRPGPGRPYRRDQVACAATRGRDDHAVAAEVWCQRRPSAAMPLASQACARPRVGDARPERGAGWRSGRTRSAMVPCALHECRFSA